mgnify:CR=1 FL=1
MSDVREMLQSVMDRLDAQERPKVEAMAEMAKEAALWLSLGGFQETGPDPDRVYNAHVFVTDEGELASVYRKVHLFDVDVPNGPVLQESSYTAPGGGGRGARHSRPGADRGDDLLRPKVGWGEGRRSGREVPLLEI